MDRRRRVGTVEAVVLEDLDDKGDDEKVVRGNTAKEVE